MIKMFLDSLPTTGKGINWRECNNYNINGINGENKFTFKILGYEKTKKHNLTIQYNGKEYDINTSNLLRCKLGNIIGKEEKINWKYKKQQRLIDYNNDGSIKRDLTIIDIKTVKLKQLYNKKYYKYKCNICGFDGGYHWSIKDKEYKDELWIEESSLSIGKGCSCCCLTPRIVVKNINSVYKTDPWMISYIGEECAKIHTHSSNDKIKAKCPNCGKVKNKKIQINTIYRHRSIGCTCGDGIKYPNKFSYELLNQLNLLYKFDYLEHEYSPEWIGQKRYDNYFIHKGKEYILEMDGGLGHGKKDNNLNGQTAEESKSIDDYKDELAERRGIEVVRIDCDYGKLENRFKYIKQNIINNKKLNELFDLSLVDWNKCDTYALSSLIKKAWELKKHNSELTTTQIGRVIGIKDKGTIQNWLEIGNKLNHCKYKAKNNSMPIKIFDKDMNFIMMFQSAIECERQSERIFKIKLIASNIGTVCSGNRKLHKGYIFKHTSQQEYEQWLEEQNKLVQAI